MPEFTIQSDLAGLQHAQELIEQALRTTALTAHDIFATKLAFEEALVNAIKHGNRMDPDMRVFVAYGTHAEGFAIRITDEGSGATRVVRCDPST